MHLLTFFQWLSHSSLGQFMQKSVWAFAVAETVHLIALASLGGALLVIHLSFLFAWKRTEPQKLASGLLPIVLISLIGMVMTGVLMVSEEALKCYYSPAFRAKMAALVISIVLYFTITAIQKSTSSIQTPWWVRAGAAISLLSWLSVGLAGRAIGLL
ncbi:DUF6644 family protein [Occallatibacter savannae]|uniref:DUF6644 family protein n=1 Tax=Occallatibacter savannae TaxID=1002691 RepID=UPI000D6930D8|nr:DUF6644 family protein [Occallatibacter savannae]